MRHDVLESLDVAGRKLTPSLITFGLVILSVLPLHIPAYSSVIPAFVLMSVYFWTLHRPDLLPVLAIFLIGILNDVMTGGPMGVQALILLLACWVAGAGRRLFRGRSFLAVWSGFMVIAASVAILQWIIMSINLGMLIAPRPAIFAYFLTVLLYPLFSWIFFYVQQTLPRIT